jgi:hypothetical protein
MRNPYYRLLLFLFIALTTCECSSSKKNMEVSAFIENFILLYINDEANVYLSPKDHVIKVLTENNETGYCISVIGYEKVFLTNLDSSYFGCYKIDGFEVYFYGEQIHEFVTKKSLNASKTDFSLEVNRQIVTEYDPVEYRISLFQNLAFDKMRSFKGNIYTDISELKDIAEKYLNIRDCTVIHSNYDAIYNDVEQIAYYDQGVDSLRALIYNNPMFKEIIGANYTNTRVLISIVVTTEGEVIEPAVFHSSGCKKVDSILENIVLQIPKMVPAVHRGETVNSYLGIPINLPTCSSGK